MFKSPYFFTKNMSFPPNQLIYSTFGPLGLGSKADGIASIGDFNKDGFDDYALDVINKSGTSVYVVYGNKTPEKSIQIQNFDYKNGFRLFLNNKTSPDFYQCSTSIKDAGDFNGDGYNDFLIGCGNVYKGFGSPGITYIIFGGENFAKETNLYELNGKDGIKFVGIYTGQIISGVGDFNGDGKSDIFLLNEDHKDFQNTGYLIFGTNNVYPNGFDLSKFSKIDGLVFKTPVSYGCITSVSGIGKTENSKSDSLIIATSGSVSVASPPEVYLLKGSDSFPSVYNLSEIDLAHGNMFIFESNKHYQKFYTSFDYLNGNFDFNCDGIKDFGFGFVNASHQPTLSRPGTAFIIFGGNLENKVNYIDKVNGINGSKIVNKNVKNYIPEDGFKFNAAGDFNSDGCSDVLFSSVGQNNSEGYGYLLLGNDKTLPFYNISYLNGTDGFKMMPSTSIKDNKWFLGVSINAVGDINNDGFDDIGIIAPYVKTEDIYSIAYILYGHKNDISADNEL